VRLLAQISPAGLLRADEKRLITATNHPKTPLNPRERSRGQSKGKSAFLPWLTGWWKRSKSPFFPQKKTAGWRNPPGSTGIFPSCDPFGVFLGFGVPPAAFPPPAASPLGFFSLFSEVFPLSQSFFPSPWHRLSESSVPSLPPPAFIGWGGRRPPISHPQTGPRRALTPPAPSDCAYSPHFRAISQLGTERRKKEKVVQKMCIIAPWGGNGGNFGPKPGCGPFHTTEPRMGAARGVPVKPGKERARGWGNSHLRSRQRRFLGDLLSCEVRSVPYGPSSLFPPQNGAKPKYFDFLVGKWTATEGAGRGSGLQRAKQHLDSGGSGGRGGCPSEGSSGGAGAQPGPGNLPRSSRPVFPALTPLGFQANLGSPARFLSRSSRRTEAGCGEGEEERDAAREPRAGQEPAGGTAWEVGGIRDPPQTPRSAPPRLETGRAAPSCCCSPFDKPKNKIKKSFKYRG